MITMKYEHFTFRAEDNTEIYVYSWMPDDNVIPKGILQISHGMAETASRYERFAQYLVEQGYIVYANDHRGHGKTAGKPENVGYIADKNGLFLIVKELHLLSDIIREKYPELPLFLFGHSLGSFIVQKYIILYGKELKGVILSGSNGKQFIKVILGFFITKFVMMKDGRKDRSVKLNNLMFGNFNSCFKPIRTEFDWLSRDIKEVDMYIGDPYCGAAFPAEFYYGLVKFLHDIQQKKNLKLIPNNLPIYIFSGNKDPAGDYGKGVINLYKTYKRLQIRDIRIKLYEDGRHEMLNEINREEVYLDIVNWLDNHLI
jgi:alpha-beta hydrolase superfamily lysophospholipase